jgi:predicted nucleotidyltransferase
MGPGVAPLHDLDHVLMTDGRIYRVLGDIDASDCFLGYNVYAPHEEGDRLYRGRRYKKNFIEDENLPNDVLNAYELLSVKDAVEHHDPIQAAKSMSRTFRSTIWYALYAELVNLFGPDSVGIFGSSMFGFHLTPSGAVRKDVDFVVQGLNNVGTLRYHLPKIREKLGFTPVSIERQVKQYARYQRVFRNENNSIRSIIARRWTGLQLSEDVVTTIRLRDSSHTIPLELVSQSSDVKSDIVVSGRVARADSSNLFPRRFTLVSTHGPREIYIFWWKFSTPVREGDQITLCGSLLDVKGQPVIRMTNFTRHWLRIA